eukprot:CAMPEP_0195097684 /NCGR_PEP_ID=MMETSP0448-20130528/54078_1 /TAXON_ID=66468 /ORGANISM="Heterocapsa triquestra, Strain CCMP 448" /LENGTH=36 /DNA_ID= /DNA_START= /DNA_END= /DNA_ORIENTATION=
MALRSPPAGGALRLGSERRAAGGRAGALLFGPRSLE